MRKKAGSRQTRVSAGAPEGHYRHHPDVVAQRLGDEMILVHLQTNRFYTLNSTAARLWELLGAGCGRTHLQQQMLQEFAVDESQLQEEVEAILSLLTTENLVLPLDQP